MKTPTKNESPVQDLRPGTSVEPRLAWCLTTLRHGGHRVTPLRHVLFRLLADSRVPLTMAELHAQATPEVACDLVTVYRTLTLAEELRLARRILLPNRPASYLLCPPGEHPEFLFCRSCGDVQPLPEACEVKALEESISARFGFAQLVHSLEFIGVCPQCQHAAPTH